MTIKEKFDKLGIDNAPGQESLQKETALDLRGENPRGACGLFPWGRGCPRTDSGSFEILPRA